HRYLPSFPTRRSSDLVDRLGAGVREPMDERGDDAGALSADRLRQLDKAGNPAAARPGKPGVEQRDRRRRVGLVEDDPQLFFQQVDRKSTRLNSSHEWI